MENLIKIITSNKGLRHFTIYKEGVKYRTNSLSKEEFEELDNNTINDWNMFLRNSQDYYIVK